MIPPSRVAAQLRHIASKLEKSVNPNRSLVSSDLRKIIANMQSDTFTLKTYYPDSSNEVIYKFSVIEDDCGQGGDITTIQFEQIGGSGIPTIGPVFSAKFSSYNQQLINVEFTDQGKIFSNPNGTNSTNLEDFGEYLWPIVNNMLYEYNK